MRLVITTPSAVVVDSNDVTALRAEDASGSFGVLEGHTEFLTVLSVCILHWRQRDGAERHCALRGGVLTVSGGRTVTVATRDAVSSEDLQHLEDAVLIRFRAAAEEESDARAAAAQLELAAIRRIIRHLRPGGASMLGQGG